MRGIPNRHDSCCPGHRSSQRSIETWKPSSRSPMTLASVSRPGRAGGNRRCARAGRIVDRRRRSLPDLLPSIEDSALFRVHPSTPRARSNANRACDVVVAETSTGNPAIDVITSGIAVIRPGEPFRRCRLRRRIAWRSCRQPRCAGGRARRGPLRRRWNSPDARRPARRDESTSPWPLPGSIERFS